MGEGGARAVQHSARPPNLQVYSLPLSRDGRSSSLWLSAGGGGVRATQAGGSVVGAKEAWRAAASRGLTRPSAGAAGATSLAAG